MAKFTGPSVIPGAKPELPVQTDQDYAQFFAGLKEEQAAEETPTKLPTQTAEEVATAASEEILQPTEEVDPVSLEQRKRERVPALGEKIGVDTLTSYETLKDNPFGVALARGSNVNNIIQNQLNPRIPTAKKPLLAEGKAEEAFTYAGREATTPALRGSQANIGVSQVIFDPRVLDARGETLPDGTPTVDPEFSSVLSLATENWFYQQTKIEGGLQKEPDDFLQEGQEPEVQEVVFSKAAGNEQLGRDIYRAWKRQKAFKEGKATDAYVNEEANVNKDTFVFIGDMAKEIYADANPEMIERLPMTQDGEVKFQLKRTGLNKLNSLQNFSKGFFSIPEIAPLNSISETAQPKFESKPRVKRVTTFIDKLGDTRQVDEAMYNYHTVKYVNDPMREKIALKLGLLGILNTNNPGNVYSNMFNIGDKKRTSLDGNKQKLLDEAARLTGEAKAAKLAEAAAYNPSDILIKEQDKTLTTLNSIARYSDQVNHVTFSMQGLTGRIHTQQNKYDPQQNKTIRFVVGNGSVLSWKPGQGILDQNFREIMASLFLDAKDLNTPTRLKTFNEAYQKGGLNTYIKMGQQLKSILEGFDADAAKQDVINTLDPNSTPQDANQARQVVQNLLTKYNNDDIPKDIKDFLASHKDEAPYFAEGLIELAKYDEAIKNKQNMSSTITAEMDGKTHGPATNAAILGIEGMAKRTGLIRSHDTLLTDDIDPRDAMGEFMLADIENTALIPDGKFDAYKKILELAVDDRQIFLKKSPMTMGYGQELSSLKMHVEETVYSGKNATAIRKIADDAGINHGDAVDVLHSMLINSIYNIMDKKVVDVARLLRANNLLSTLSNELLYMDNAMGFRSYAAARQVQGPEDTKNISYDIGGKGRSAILYKTKPEGSAVRAYEEGGTPVPGGFGHGRVIPIAVQSYDGNMISKTGSGQSWSRIQDKAKARGGEAFVLPIFDAFKADLASLDVVREEANRNWLNGIKDHSYVTSIMDKWFKETRAKIVSDFKKKDPKEVVKINDEGPHRGLNYLFNKTNDFGQPNIKRVLATTIDAPAKLPNQTVEEYGKQVGGIASRSMTNIFKKMAEKGIPQTFEQLTNQQVFDILTIVMNEIQLSNRNQQMVRKVTNDKAKLLGKVAQSKEARQVDLAI